MMVVHEDNERPVEVAVIRKPLLEQKSYVIVKNHVRELTNTTQNESNTKTSEKNVSRTTGNESGKKKKRKSDKSHKTSDEISTISFASDFTSSTSSKIDANDLEELKTVYMKCKEVMSRIETKYGHLMDLGTEVGHYSQSKKHKAHSDTSEEECQCQIKKKIVFDEDGKQLTVDSVSDNHICAAKIKHPSSSMNTRSRNIAVEYQDVDIKLPDDIHKLEEMLHDPNIERTVRNKVLDKIRLLKQEYVNDLKFNRHILIEKLKSNPDDVFDFKGTNLSTIPGYS